MKQFEVGKRYATTCISNHEIVLSWDVVARTKRQVTLRDVRTGETMRRGIAWKESLYSGEETIYPDGRYSLCPVLTPDNEVHTKEYFKTIWKPKIVDF